MNIFPKRETFPSQPASAVTFCRSQYGKRFQPRINGAGHAASCRRYDVGDPPL